ncbi:cyclic nucleotide-binding domain-containing protein [Paenibacillus filicis]|uniref:Cyclic nucleotide-binding domain-containing protein n=1 Tax=Paenibacillus filicis TaxID=669464 RepID=A0ABU9DIQ1_9BACL
MNKLTFLEIPLFEGLDRVHKAALLQEFTQLSFRRGDLLFEEGEFGDSLYIIMQGSARIYLKDSGSGETTLAILGEKEYFGEMALLTGDPRSASAKADSDLVVLQMLKESFDRILYEHNALAVQFAGILAKRLARVNRQSGAGSLTRDEQEKTQLVLPGAASSAGAAAAEEEGEGEAGQRVEASAEADQRWLDGWLLKKGAGNPTVLYKALPICLAILIAVPLGYVVTTYKADRTVSVPAVMTGGPLGPERGLEVPFVVELPRDAVSAASIRQGVELAMTELQQSSVSRHPLTLKPEYRGSGEDMRSGRTVPVWTLAAASDSDSNSAKRSGLPTILLEGAAAASAPSVALAPSTEGYAQAVTDLLLRHGFGKVVIYYEDSAPGKQFAAALEKWAEQQGLLVVDRLASIPSRSGLTAAWSRWRLLGTEAVVVYDASGSVTPEISAGLASLGARYPLLVGPSIPGTDVLTAYKGEVYGYSDFDKNSSRMQTKAFIERYRLATGTEPSRLAAAAYDAMRLIALSADRAGAAEPAGMYEALKGIGRWEGALRSYDFSSGSTARDDALVQFFSLTPKSVQAGEMKR